MRTMDRNWGSDDEDGNNLSCIERLENEPVAKINARLLVDALREVLDSTHDYQRFLAILQAVANQNDPFLRSEVLEQIPKLATVCDGLEGGLDLIEKDLLPVVLRALADSDAQVRKTAQAALLVLVEQDLLSPRVLEEDVCGVVVNLADYSISNGISLMGKLAQLLGREVTIRLFLDKYAECCADEEFTSLREICAKNFGEICAVIGSELSSSKMVPLFCGLCQDEAWIVRKTCAEVFMLVSCSVPLATRRDALAPSFLRLLADNNQWVRLMAHQVLGAFITTFADPPVSNIAYDNCGELVFVGLPGFEFRATSHPHMPQRMCLSIPGQTEWSDVGSSSISCLPSPVPKCYGAENEDGETDDEFNTFRYWQLPILELEDALEEDQIEANIISLDNELTCLSEKLDKCTSKDLSESNKSVISDASTTDSGWNSGATTPLQTEPLSLRYILHRCSEKRNLRNPKPEVLSKQAQSIVPQGLVDSYLRMSEPTSSGEIALHCAYFFPAVAYTLGRDNWPWLLNLFRSLALDHQWKVRRTIASCLIELTILGDDIINRDLAPVLKALLKDLDEVRIGALRYLAHILKKFKPSVRDSFLPLLKEFLENNKIPQSDNDRNWRFRKEVAVQLQLACSLFSPSDSLEYICPTAFSLLGDKIAAVRKKAVPLMVELVQLPNADSIFDVLKEDFAKHPLWSRRAVFVQLCSEMSTQNALEVNNFGSNLLPYMFELARDPVANVRLIVARCLASLLTGNVSEPYFDEVCSTLESLKQDPDRDVKEAAMTECTNDSSRTSTCSTELSLPLPGLSN